MARMSAAGADLMTGWLMKAFNVSFYDDRRLCFMEGCTPSMIAFKWDHAVRAHGLTWFCLNLPCCLQSSRPLKPQ